MISIAERPAEVEDRAVPGNWEGDLIIGKQNQTAIGTLVERQTGYAMLLHLPDGQKPEQVRDALAAKIQTLPDSLRLSLTWDQGPPDARLEARLGRRRYRHLLLRPPLALAAWHQRKLQVACYVSTSPRAPISACTAARTWTGSPSNSTTDPAND